VIICRLFGFKNRLYNRLFYEKNILYCTALFTFKYKNLALQAIFYLPTTNERTSINWLKGAFSSTYETKGGDLIKK
jgi:hypothetical protein